MTVEATLSCHRCGTLATKVIEESIKFICLRCDKVLMSFPNDTQGVTFNMNDKNMLETDK